MFLFLLYLNGCSNIQNIKENKTNKQNYTENIEEDSEGGEGVEIDEKFQIYAEKFEIGYKIYFAPVIYQTEDKEYIRVDWDFGDESLESINIIKPCDILCDTYHIYKNPGLYKIKMTAYFSDKSVDYDIKNIEIFNVDINNINLNIMKIDDQNYTIESSEFWNEVYWNLSDGTIQKGLCINVDKKIDNVTVRQTDLDLTKTIKIC